MADWDITLGGQNFMLVPGGYKASTAGAAREDGRTGRQRPPDAHVHAAGESGIAGKLDVLDAIGDLGERRAARRPTIVVHDDDVVGRAIGGQKRSDGQRGVVRSPVVEDDRGKTRWIGFRARYGLRCRVVSDRPVQRAQLPHLVR